MSVGEAKPWSSQGDVPGLATITSARHRLAESDFVALVGRAQLAVLGRFSDLSPVWAGRIRAEHLQVHREERELLEGQRQGGVLGMPFDVGVELGREERATELITLELGHVDAVRGEAAHRLVERGRHVSYPEHEGRDHRPGVHGEVPGLARQHEEARRVVVLVLDVLEEDLQAVELRGQPGRERRNGRVGDFGDLTGGARGVVGDG